MRKTPRSKVKVKAKVKAKAFKKIPSDAGWIEISPRLQKTLRAIEIENPYINGIEGFFILESSIKGLKEKHEKYSEYTSRETRRRSSSRA